MSRFDRGLRQPRNLRSVVEVANRLAASGHESEHIGLITVRLNTTALKLRRLRDQKAVMTSISHRIRNGLGAHVRAIREGLEEFTVVAVTPTAAEFTAAVERIALELDDPHELPQRLPSRRKTPQLFNVPATVAGAGLQVDDIDHKRQVDVEGESKEFDGEELIQRTNIVQHAITQGWGVFDPDDKKYQDAKQDLLLIKAMPEALSNGEFTVVSQPIVDRDGAWVASESLVRWNSAEPEPKFISPDKFIALAEEHGFIGDLGHWILRESCEAAMAWHRKHTLDDWPEGMAKPKPPEGQKMPIVSVNVSPKQLENPAFAKEVLSVLASTGLPPEVLQLELTEGGQVDLGSDQIQELVAAKVRFSMDDYGTQTANLDYLAKAAKLDPPPISNVKLDILLLGGPEKLRTAEVPDEYNLELIESTTRHVARELPNADCTIEGVERPEWIPELAERGCKKFQGFGIGRPGPYGPPRELKLGQTPDSAPVAGPSLARRLEQLAAPTTGPASPIPEQRQPRPGRANPDRRPAVVRPRRPR